MVRQVVVRPKPFVERLLPGLMRALITASLVGIFVVVHGPTHLVAIFSPLLRQSQWQDTVQITLSPAMQALIWLPALLLIGVFMLRNRGTQIMVEQTHSRRDLIVAGVAGLIGVAIRVWPLLQDSWIKLNFDDGVYLGATWLMLQGALPYRDFVLAHPPGVLALLTPAALLIAPFNDNNAALFAARLTAIIADGATIGLIYLAARQLVRPPAALFAAAVYASDALVIQFARGVRLEPLQAPWLAAGAMLVLMTLNGRRKGLLAGIFLGLGIAVKLTGGLVLIAAVVAFVVERRWTALRDLLVGATVVLCLVFGLCVLTSGDEIIRQTVLLQFSRTTEPGERWTFMLGDARTGLTAMALLGGTIALGSIAWRRTVASGWIFISLWLMLTLVLFAKGASFYDHYYDKLALPAALLAAALPEIVPSARRWHVGVAVCSAFFLALAANQAGQWMSVNRDPGDTTRSRECGRAAARGQAARLFADLQCTAGSSV